MFLSCLLGREIVSAYRFEATVGDERILTSYQLVLGLSDGLFVEIESDAHLRKTCARTSVDHFSIAGEWSDASEVCLIPDTELATLAIGTIREIELVQGAKISARWERDDECGPEYWLGAIVRSERSEFAIRLEPEEVEIESVESFERFLTVIPGRLWQARRRISS